MDGAKDTLENILPWGAREGGLLLHLERGGGVLGEQLVLI